MQNTNASGCLFRSIRNRPGASLEVSKMYGEPCSDPYFVRQSGPLVEAWSAHRLPFEPKGWLASFRGDIRARAQALQSGKDQVLHAVYASRSTDLCDAENILFYNVGPGCFASAARHGVRFERSHAHPAPPSPRSSLYPHHHRYAVTRAVETFTCWTPGQIWARWRNVEV